MPPLHKVLQTKTPYHMKTKIYFLQQLNYNHIHHHVCLLQGHGNALSVQWHVYHSFEWHIIVTVKIKAGFGNIC